ncbi:uncharacterized protein VDAG_03971 [Verticillium dahliae VdLs.17]|uniref:C2H2-type domain-containing protein n=2 Tax=Verticillium dahliae TaxID=27337 RepID=G2X142_VERDV|nr:uncharacterized protein VDAG_03971 [Verticillium dahliae VdLs.17]EGY22533.1 hypothetical protein VDAG_03971 [Verticillium dahliae VdLs.17]KAH6704956.1 hypothetical protein EV126DRAFT_380953 [Verticillium dahliae]
MSDYISNNTEWEALVIDAESLHPDYAQDYFDPMGFYPYDAQAYFDPMDSFDYGATASFALPSEPSYLPQRDSALGANGYSPINDTGNSLAGVDIAEMPYIPDIPGDHFYGTGPLVQHTFTQGTALLEPNNGSHVYPALLENSYTEFDHPTDLAMTGQPSFSAGMVGMGAERHADGRSSATFFSTMSPPDNEGPVNAPPDAGFRCAECSEYFSWEGILDWHARQTEHMSYKCNFPACHEKFMRYVQYETHKRRSHAEGHGRVTGVRPFFCAQCQSDFKNDTGLGDHALTVQHQPFQCTCGQSFSRLDVLYRRKDIYSQDMPKHPCRYCKRHRGRNGFKRKDHLRQHMRAFHKFDADERSKSRQSRRKICDVPVTCPHSGCFGYRDEHFHALEAAEQDQDRPFNSQKDFNEHMRKVHDETSFPCSVSGCDKVGAKGYLREKALIDHYTAKHPELEAYVPKPWVGTLIVRCRHPGCISSLKRGSLIYHMRDIHRYRD